MEIKRLVAGCNDGDVVRPRGQLEMMEIAAELFDEAGVRAVDKHLSAPRIDVELHPAERRALEWRFVHTHIRIAAVERYRESGAPRPEAKTSGHQSGNKGTLPDERPG